MSEEEKEFQALLIRINELAKKDKEEGLTEEEIKEREILREKYLEGFRNQFRETLMGVTVIDEQGTDVTPEKLKEAQKNHKKNLN